MENQSDNQKAGWSLAGAVTAALASTACCTIPLILVAFGVGGGALASLRATGPYRPFFVLIAVVALFYAHHRMEKAAREDCATGVCSDPHTRRRNRIIFWSATLLVALMLASPWLAAALLG